MNAMKEIQYTIRNPCEYVLEGYGPPKLRREKANYSLEEYNISKVEGLASSSKLGK